MKRLWLLATVCLAATLLGTATANAGFHPHFNLNFPVGDDPIPGLSVEYLGIHENEAYELSTVVGAPGAYPDGDVGDNNFSPSPFKLWKITFDPSTPGGFTQALFQTTFEVYGVFVDTTVDGLESGEQVTFNLMGVTLANWSAGGGDIDTIYVTTATPELASLGIWGTLCLGGVAARQLRRRKLQRA